MQSPVSTRFLVISDTHGDDLKHIPEQEVDVAIHCGDLTEESKLNEFETSVQLLKAIKAPLKLVIAGNHDFTLDTPAFKKKLAEVRIPIEEDLLKQAYGDFGEARQLFEAEHVKAAGIVFLDEGTHRFTLANGALLTVYASPYTPSLSADWGFQYRPEQEHDWSIERGTDIAITHGPSRGLLDYTDSRQRAGSPGLFAAVAHARPKVHCFGHIHEGWGAKMVTWRETLNDTPSHFTDIDNDRSQLIEHLPGLKKARYDTPDEAERKVAKLQEYKKKGYCNASVQPEAGTQTLFVNAAIQGLEDESQQLPWVIELDLQRAEEHHRPASP